MILNEHFIDFLNLLNKHEVKYVLVGGWAVVFKGYGRTTGDMDIFIERSKENADKMIEVIKGFSGSSLGFKKDDFLNENEVIMIGRIPFRIDILTSITGVSFGEAYFNSSFYEEGNLKVRVIHINQLIKNKKESGRLKDLADVEMLEKILKKRGNKNKE